ncbi:MAG: hypothetical protein WD576_02280 [Nitriliruptoraceae bacterium]
MAVACDIAASDAVPGTDDAAPITGSPATGMCAPEVPDCVDVVIDPDGTVGEPAAGGDIELDERDTSVLRSDAHALLGVTESELDPAIRVSRRGDEHFAVTEDYVIGRMTVELDERDGDYVVSVVVLELPDGPETFDE